MVTRVRMSPKNVCLFTIACVLLLSLLYLSRYESNEVQEVSFERLPLTTTTVHSKKAPERPKITVINADITKPQTGQQGPGTNEVESCKIPKLEQNNQQIMAQYTKPTPLRCNKKYPANWLFVDTEGNLKPTDYGIKNIGIDNMACNVSYFYRQTDSELSWKNAGIVKLPYKVNDGDYIRVVCNAGEKKWRHFFMVVVPKPEVMERASKAVRDAAWTGLSVYWFAFDSMSQMAFRRSLPKTVAFLEEELGAVVLNGYNIVGDGTPQAYIPILTGKTELELPLTRKRYPEAKFVDVYPFVWNNFSTAGYATLYGEDAARIGTFTYRLKGFNKQPTDHYTRTFFLQSETNFPSTHCFGSETQFAAWCRYGREFMEKYPKEVPKFSVLHHSDLSHDDITLVQVADEDLVAHFKGMKESGALDNAIVFVGADHGHRFSALRETQQGQMEERMPFMSIALPKNFRSTERGAKVFENLKKNADRLSSPFDMHATLLDVLSLPQDLDTPQDVAKRSLSLFRPVPESRTCSQAGIEAHWCTCLAWQAAPDPTVSMLADAVVQTINSYTAPERKLCAPLKLDKVVEGKMLAPDEKVLKYGGVKDNDGFVPNFVGNATTSFATYMITFTTTPGTAKYEATVKYDSFLNDVTVDMLAISHVTKYGDTPHCIIDKNYFLATYCVCYDRISVP